MGLILRRRLAVAIPTLLLVTVVIFLMVHLIPGDPIGVQLARQPDPVVRAALERLYGLDLPLPQQYLNWLTSLVRLDMGRSFASGEAVFDLIIERLPRTLALLMGGLLVSLIIAIPAGVIAASRAGTRSDRSLTAGALFLMAIPEFWAGTLLVLVFAVNLKWLPTSGYVEPWIDPIGFLRHMILPCLALGATLAGLTMRTLRSSVTEVMRHDYVLLAEAQGASHRRVVWVHSLRNAMTPTITLVGLQIGLLFAGAIVTERVFSYPGVGNMLVSAVSSRDYPVIQGCILVLTFVFVLVNIGTDLSVAYLEPRIRRPPGFSGSVTS